MRCYQRLEYLGDAVLDFLVTKYLFEQHRELSPGKMTLMRQAAVCNETFSFLAVKYHFKKLIKQSSPELFAKMNQYQRALEV